MGGLVPGSLCCLRLRRSHEMPSADTQAERFLCPQKFEKLAGMPAALSPSCTLPDQSGPFKGSGPFTHAGPIFRVMNLPSQRLMMVVQLQEPLRASLRLPAQIVESILHSLGLRQLKLSALVCRQ